MIFEVSEILKISENTTPCDEGMWSANLQLGGETTILTLMQAFTTLDPSQTAEHLRILHCCLNFLDILQCLKLLEILEFLELLETPTFLECLEIL